MRLLLLLSLFIPFTIFGQQVSEVKPRLNGWHLLDQEQDGYLGISLGKAYELLKGRQSTTIIVAVIDSGIDTAQEDIRNILWRNLKEVSGNGIDDDGNGYVDDIYGWNFCGSPDGKNMLRNSLEVPRVYHGWKEEFEGVKEKNIPKEKKFLYSQWVKAANMMEEEYQKANKELPEIIQILEVLENTSGAITSHLEKDSFKVADIRPLKVNSNKVIASAAGIWDNIFSRNEGADITQVDVINEIAEYKAGLEFQLTKKTTPPEDWRSPLVKDNYTDINDRIYGNNNLKEGAGDHGTLVSGTIAASRNNGIGMDGIADNVRIMAIRAVPGGDEHDKDIALAIRYAVDNGARVINMSFGKPVSPYKHFVDEAVRYAESKNVLLVHGVGNDGKDITEDHFYPHPAYIDGSFASNYLSVGASGDPSTGNIAAPFSNYSRKYVDLFAPGMNIYATAHDNRYVNADGTSLASPVAAGVAALLLSYFPDLTPKELIAILKESATPVNMKVTLPGQSEKKAAFSSLSSSGKIINAYEAVKLALER